MQDDGWILRNTIIWKKNNAMPVPAPDRFLPTYEYFFFFVKSENYYFDLEQSKKSTFKGKDIITVNIEPFEKHQATFPPSLIYPMIEISSKKNDIIMDPFGGSGTVGRIAKRTARKFIIIEINKEFCQVAKKSIAETLALAEVNEKEKIEQPIDSATLFDTLS
jgi:DNA modification methylase